MQKQNNMFEPIMYIGNIVSGMPDSGQSEGVRRGRISAEWADSVIQLVNAKYPSQQLR